MKKKPHAEFIWMNEPHPVTSCISTGPTLAVSGYQVTWWVSFVTPHSFIFFTLLPVISDLHFLPRVFPTTFLSSSSSLCTSLSQYLSVCRFSLISPVFRVFLVYWINACSRARLCLFPCRVCLPVLMTYQCTSKQMKTQHVSQKAPGRVIFVLFVVRMNVLEINYKFWGHSEAWSWSVYPSEHSPPWHLLYCSENSSLKPRHCTQRLRPHTHTVKWPLGACLQPRLPAYIIRVFLCVSMQWGWSAVCLC